MIESIYSNKINDFRPKHSNLNVYKIKDLVK